MIKPIGPLKRIDEMNKAEVSAEIQRLEKKLEGLQLEVLRVEEIINGLQSLHDNWREEGAEAPGGYRPRRGRVLEKTLEIVCEQSLPVTARNVVEALKRIGVRPSGDPKNFHVTVAKALRRLVELGKISESRDRTGHVSYRANDTRMEALSIKDFAAVAPVKNPEVLTAAG